MKTPLEAFGYSYSVDGMSFAFHIVAHSHEEAEGRRAAMASVLADGRLIKHDQPPNYAISKSTVQQLANWIRCALLKYEIG